MPHRNMAEIVNRRNPVTLPATASVQQAYQMMRQHRIGAIPVTDEGGRLIGLFSGRDAVTHVLADARDPMQTQIGAAPLQSQPLAENLTLLSGPGGRSASFWRAPSSARTASQIGQSEVSDDPSRHSAVP